MDTQEITIKVTELYVGILGRAADQAGLDYWVNQINNGSLTLENTRASFANKDQPEYWNAYGNLSHSDLVDKVYNNFLNRVPDQAGKAYWVEELNSGTIEVGHFINAIINGVQDTSKAADSQRLKDIETLSNKVEAAQYFTSRSQTVDSSTNEFTEKATNSVKSVTDAQSLNDSKKQTDIDTILLSITVATDTVDTFTTPSINLQEVRNSFTPGFDGKFVIANDYGDFNGDGHMDIFMAPGVFLSPNKTPFEILINDGNDNFSFDNTLINGQPEGTFNSRKAVVADFNGDGKDDVILADHGIDVDPFPGAPVVLLLSSEEGLKQASGLDHLVGFHHSVSVGDIDRDGDEDAFFTRDSSGESIFLINDGTGNMSFQDGLVPSETYHKPYYTSELIDVDKDGKLDLLMAGHEYDNADTVIYWGSDQLGYTSELKTILPKAPNGHQIVVDIDVADINGDNINDLIYHRVGNTPEFDFYGDGGSYLQVLTGNQSDPRNFTDISASAIDNAKYASTVGGWMEWVRLADLDSDGDLDIYLDDSWKAKDELILLNNGNGEFIF